MSIQSINPATGAPIATYPELGPDQVLATVEHVHRAFLQWRGRDFSERAEPMRAAARILRERAGDLARLMAQEMGKPITEGVAEAQKCATACDFFADNAAQFLAREAVILDGAKSFVTFQPLGVILAVMPWNFPFWQVVRFAAPALMAGNAVALKHSSNVPACALEVERIFQQAGFPENLLRTLLIGSAAVEATIEHPRIRAVTLTGSGPAGRAVARKAGEMLKKTVLELGGSDAYLVLGDSDVQQAAELSVKGRLVNAGQSCIAAKRFIVVDDLRSSFERLFVEKMQAVKVGDPMQLDTQVGPMARHDLRDSLHDQVQESIAQGARCLCGGHIPNGPGAYYPPTVLTDVRKGMPAYEEELFGPVAAVIPVTDEAQAIETANDSAFGLGGGIFTRDIERGERLASEAMDAGFVCVNDTVRSDPRLPFGGIKESGYGRELSHYGIREFVNIKTVVVAGNSHSSQVTASHREAQPDDFQI
jgi:succinate-semialdehyde dehydrogenase / glutarate-semialdehyde dehydrogenase